MLRYGTSVFPSLSQGFLMVGLVVSPAVAQEPAKAHPKRWDELASVKPGTKIAIRIEDACHRTFGEEVKGTYQAANAEGVTVQLSDDRAQTIPRNAVARITAKTKGRPYAPWVGLAVGTAVGAGIVSSATGHEFTGSGHLAFGALFGGAPGAVAGYLVHRLGRKRVIYRRAGAPEPSRRSQSGSTAGGSLSDASCCAAEPARAR